MGQKHNRRRIRTRTRRRVNKATDQHTTLAFTQQSIQPYHDARILGAFSPLPPSYFQSDCMPISVAPQWHNRYMAVQAWERRQREEAAKLEAEQCRLFGGEPGDDVALCHRMLEYFGGLDYID
ncbi:hypothetical protein AJ80_00080 [Polytolypa hystricis UAMH7299]|uniref:Uncharacterized protein n=1 Tax=Polytolypa hystricis (strain UAMH7299) TaxID=1447883 RepID=A0A2B7Z456_POLH7|nr:hypothetical protein AJ80_00080 [Polytolypa hystricis UAMH7299]